MKKLKIKNVKSKMIWLIFNFTFLIFNSFSYSQTPNSEYADRVVSYKYSGANPYFSNLYGGEGYNYPIPMNPNLIAGPNTSYFVSLPTGTYIILEFTNNKIVDYPNQNDIFVTENGCNYEQAEVHVSSDGIKFTLLGTVNDCEINSIDLASIGYKESVRFVKVVGLDFGGASPGFDLVNVKGLPKSSVDVIEDAITDSLDNLLVYGFLSENKENAAGNEWVIESENLKDAELTLFDPDKNKISIHYRLIEINKIIIDASGFKKGVYLLEIKLDNEVISQKINIV